MRVIPVDVRSGAWAEYPLSTLATLAREIDGCTAFVALLGECAGWRPPAYYLRHDTLPAGDPRLAAIFAAEAAAAAAAAAEGHPPGAGGATLTMLELAHARGRGAALARFFYRRDPEALLGDRAFLDACGLEELALALRERAELGARLAALEAARRAAAAAAAAAAAGEGDRVTIQVAPPAPAPPAPGPGTPPPAPAPARVRVRTRARRPRAGARRRSEG